jgi:hypothetical protein
MDMMPKQLREGLRRHPKGSRPPRPIAEQLPAISVNELTITNPYDYKTYIADLSLKYPPLVGAKISYHVIEFHLASLHRDKPGPVFTFRLKHIRTGFGVRHAFICTCQRPVIKLYYLHRKLACRRCHDATYASRTCSKRQRAVLQVSRIQSFLDNKLGLYRRTRERLTKKLGEKVMMAQGSLGTSARSLWK